MKYYNKEQLKAALAECNRKLSAINTELEELKQEVKKATPETINSLVIRLRVIQKEFNSELLNVTALRNLLNKQAA